MREILVRGKRTHADFYGKRGEWVYGIPIENKIGMFISFEKNPHYCGQYDYMEIKEISRVDPETVGEFTGLTDTSGNRIFEGDILKCYDDKIETEFMAVVEFGNPNGTYSWGWQLKPISGDKNANPDILLWVDMEETGAICEVIGNIHDNPELLKDGAKGMTERERLIEILNQEPSRYSEDIADHLLKNCVIVPPCKVGDTVYKIVDDCTYGDDCYTKRMCKTCDFRDLHIEPEILSRISDIVQRLSDFDKTEFLTREEAEKALKERERE